MKKNIKHLFICFIFFVFSTTNQAQTSEIALREVVFHPSLSVPFLQSWIVLRPDDEFIPQWTKFVRVWDIKEPTKSHPVAYVSGCKASVSARFIDQFTTCPTKPVYVKAISSDMKYKLPSKQLSENLEYPITEMDKIFPKHLVQFIPDFTLNWYFTTTPEIENSWKLVGSNTHLLMTVHKAPYYQGLPGDNEALTSFYTTIYISCKAANGKGGTAASADPDAVVEAIFDEFRDRCVSKAGGTNCMKYWGGVNPLIPNPTCRSIYGLLQYEDANCGEWSSFFQDMLKIQGITTGKRLTVTYQDEFLTQNAHVGVLNSATENKLYDEILSFFGSLDLDNVKVYKTESGDRCLAYFFVNFYDFYATPPPTLSNFYLDGHKPDPPLSNYGINTNVTNMALMASDREGAAGQGKSDPKAWFENHNMMSYKKKSGTTVYFDPSYGIPNTGFYSSLNDYESASMTAMGASGTYKYFDPNGTSFLFVRWFWVNETNNSTQQLIFR